MPFATCLLHFLEMSQKSRSRTQQSQFHRKNQYRMFWRHVHRTYQLFHWGKTACRFQQTSFYPVSLSDSLSIKDMKSKLNIVDSLASNVYLNLTIKPLCHSSICVRLKWVLLSNNSISSSVSTLLAFLEDFWPFPILQKSLNLFKQKNQWNLFLRIENYTTLIIIQKKLNIWTEIKSQSIFFFIPIYKII